MRMVNEPLEINTLISGTEIIGRGFNTTINIAVDDISRQHARLRLLTPEKVEVQDLDSLNGTYVNGKRIAKDQKAMATIGDKLRFGGCVTVELTS